MIPFLFMSCSESNESFFLQSFLGSFRKFQIRSLLVENTDVNVVNVRDGRDGLHVPGRHKGL